MISVLIPVYNGESFLRRALDSVFCQTAPPSEVIVLDDGSSDGTAEIASSYSGVKLLRQANQGIGASRRRLIEESSCEWVAFLDHDDFWMESKLAKQLPHTGRAEVGVIHTGDVFFFLGGRRQENTWSPLQGGAALDHVLPDCRVNMSSVLIRRKAVLEAGNFDESISKAEDWLMWLQLAGKWEFAFVGEPLTWTYKHMGSASTPNAAWYEAERHVIEDLILPEFDRLYQRFTHEHRDHFRTLVQKKLGAIASLQAEALDREGRRSEARKLHLHALRQSPLKKGSWLRLGKHLAHL